MNGLAGKVCNTLQNSPNEQMTLSAKTEINLKIMSGRLEGIVENTANICSDIQFSTDA